MVYKCGSSKSFVYSSSTDGLYVSVHVQNPQVLMWLIHPGVVPNKQCLTQEVEEVWSHHVRCLGIVKTLLHQLFSCQK